MIVVKMGVVLSGGRLKGVKNISLFMILLLQEELSCRLLSHRGPDIHVKEVISITEKVSLSLRSQVSIYTEEEPHLRYFFKEIVADERLNE